MKKAMSAHKGQMGGGKAVSGNAGMTASGFGGKARSTGGKGQKGGGSAVSGNAGMTRSGFGGKKMPC